jgi:hypothetical protein
METSAKRPLDDKFIHIFGRRPGLEPGPIALLSRMRLRKALGSRLGPSAVRDDAGALPVFAEASTGKGTGSDLSFAEVSHGRGPEAATEYLLAPKVDPLRGIETQLTKPVSG